jgi:hypothetical protein
MILVFIGPSRTNQIQNSDKSLRKRGALKEDYQHGHLGMQNSTQLKMQNKNQIAKIELKPLQIGGKNLNPIQTEIINGILIRQTDSDDLILKALRKIFILIGLRHEQMPTQPEIFVLIEFIRKRISNYTANELVIAFEMAIAGDFKADTEHFGQFTAKYLSQVFNAYKVNRNETAVKVQREIEKNKAKELEENEKGKAEQFKKESIRIYKASLIVKEWQGDIFNANAIARDIAPSIHQHIKDEIWQEAQVQKNKQDSNYQQNPDKMDLSNVGLTAKRIFSELIVIEGIKQRIKL